ncbi:AT-hook motif nuclear-localized protein 20 [Euphorbia peplus]|nr:AT-hook motif nuclear-localized protein 20 [Euphorbia peplus]
MSHFAATNPLCLSKDTSDDSSSGQSPVPPPPPPPPSPPSSAKRTPAPLQPLPENSQRKPRGRPPGSKNKPKPPIIITRESDTSLKPVILEIATGSDIIQSIMQLASKNHVGVTVLSATGMVGNITLRHPNAHAPSLSLHGPFHLLAFSGTFLGPSRGYGFGVSLAGGQGQVFGGIVAGKVVAASLVMVVAATFMNPTIHRVPRGDEEEDGDDDMEPMNVYATNVANPTPLNCQLSTDGVHWPPHY